MLNRIKIVNAMLFILCLLGAVQIFSGAWSLRGLNIDRDNFHNFQYANERRTNFTEAWIGLLKIRINFNRILVRARQNVKMSDQDEAFVKALFKDSDNLMAQSQRAFDRFNSLPATAGVDVNSLRTLNENYTTFAELLKKGLLLVNQEKYEALSQLKIQDAQVSTQKSYELWRTLLAEATEQGVHENAKNHKFMLWTLSTATLFIIALIIFSWKALRQMLIRPLNVSLHQLHKIATGDLSHEIKPEGRNEMSQLSSSILEMQRALIRTVNAVRLGAEAIHSGATEISAGSDDLSSRTEQQAASLEETAASMEQLTATVRLNADNARQVSQLARDASSSASKGGDVVNDVINTMSEITSSSHEIADIVNVIDGIAFQTNILALNAAVEAARAGEQGRGFAVVAGEVRSLAQRSAMAAKEIKGLIEKSTNRIQNGSVQVEHAGKTMAEIVDSITSLTTIMDEIATASEEQSRGIEQVGTAVSEMDTVTQQNASLVEESAAAGASLKDQAERLIQAVSVFSLGNQAAKSSVQVPITPARKKLDTEGNALIKNENEGWSKF